MDFKDILKEAFDNDMEVLKKAYDTDMNVLKKAYDADKKILDVAAKWTDNEIGRMGRLLLILQSKNIITEDDCHYIFTGPEEEYNEC